MACLTGLFNLVSNVSAGTHLGEYLARRNEYVEFFGGGLRGRFGACQRGQAGLIFSHDFQERLVQEAQRRERERISPSGGLRRRLRRLRQMIAEETAKISSLTAAAASEMAAELGLPADSLRLVPGSFKLNARLDSGLLGLIRTQATAARGRIRLRQDP